MRPFHILRVALIAAVFAGSSSSAGQDDQTEAFLDDLRAGGYVIYWRHALTDRTQDDTDMSSCATQRNLNAQGIADAALIGEAFAALNIPVGDVLSTEFCRNRDTATLAFGRYEDANDLLEAEGVTARLSAVPTAGQNTILVGHGLPLLTATGLEIAEGDMVIVQPDGAGSYIVMATIRPAGWAELYEIYAQDAITEPQFDEFPVPQGSHPHDVAPAPDGTVWYTGQHRGTLGRLDPETGDVTEIALGPGSSPHGVIVGPDGAPWVTDSGLNAIVRVDPDTEEVSVYRLPAGFSSANLNTAAFDDRGVLWFTGQSGVYGSFDPETETMIAYRAPRGRGPYGIDATPDGEVYYVSLAGSYLAEIDEETGEVTVIDPPTQGAGTRRVWSDSRGRLWITEYNAGNLAMYDPEGEAWREWALPGGRSARPYAVVVDERDGVWISDFASNSLLRFDPETETFEQFPLSRSNATVRQMLDAPGEVWAAQSGIDSLLRVTLETVEMEDD